MIRRREPDTSRMNPPAPRLLVALPPGPVATWRIRTVDALRAAGAKVRHVRVPTPAARPVGPLAAAIFATERLWSDGNPSGLEPGSSAPEDDPFDGEPDVRLSLAGAGAFSGPPPAGGDLTVGFPDAGDPLEAARQAVLTGAPHVVVRLRRSRPDGSTDVRECVAGVVPFSSADTVKTLVALAAALPARALRGVATPEAEALADTPAPRRADALRHLCALLREGLRDLFTRKQWRLLIAAGETTAPDPAKAREHIPPPDRIRADPFVVVEHGETRLFFEEMTFREHRGFIASARLEGTALSDFRPALVGDRHLSYPQVFRLGGKLRLTTECARSGAVRLHDCERWPDRWSAGAVIFEGPMIDPSLFFHDGRFWLLGNLPPGPEAKADGELHAFFTDDPLSGRWTPHAGNPVVSDARFGRGAGRPFVRDGRLFRPAQDCAGGYGRRVILREIVRLTPEIFEERTAGMIGPPAGATTLHTLNLGGGVTVTDIARRVPRFF